LPAAGGLACGLITRYAPEARGGGGDATIDAFHRHGGSIRRRVLWVTPLAMLGIVAVSQLSHPFDEQDAIRQTTKYCLFASGVVVVIATLILACTSLPKEIENRVIYTIVTKPATRLEIVLGKTLGFARTSAAILLIMGVFSYAYLHVNSAQLMSAIRTRLANLPQTDVSRETLQHYADEGLLQARTYTRPVGSDRSGPAGLQVYARLPQPGDKFTWIFGNNEQNVLYPFTLSDDVFARTDAMLVFTIQTATSQRPLNAHELETEPRDSSSATRPSSSAATTTQSAKMPGPPYVSATILNENGYTVVAGTELIDAMHPPDPSAKNAPQFANANLVKLEPSGRPDVGVARVVAEPKSIQEKMKNVPAGADGRRHFYLMVGAPTPATRYGFAPDAVTLDAQLLDPSGKPVELPLARGENQPLIFRGRMSSTRHQQLRGDPNRAESPVAVFQFKEQNFHADGDSVPFEFHTKVERSGEAETTEGESGTRVEVVVRNHASEFASPPIEITVDSDRPTFFRVPRAAVDGGDFEVQLRSRTEGHYVGVRANSLAVVSSTQSFAFNLFKSLLILWMLSVLVVIISVFCSTFVSWPIAVVLTLVILLGRWCVTQMGDPASPQQMVTDIFGANASPAGARVFTDTVSALNKLLVWTAKVLPDLDQFRVTEDIEHGVSISYRSLIDPAIVLLVFGLPMVMLAYVVLRRKEVAP